MVFSVINDKPFPDQAAEKIFQIGQVVQKFDIQTLVHVSLFIIQYSNNE